EARERAGGLQRAVAGDSARPGPAARQAPRPESRARDQDQARPDRGLTSGGSPPRILESRGSASSGDHPGDRAAAGPGQGNDLQASARPGTGAGLVRPDNRADWTLLLADADDERSDRDPGDNLRLGVLDHPRNPHDCLPGAEAGGAGHAADLSLD